MQQREGTKRRRIASRQQAGLQPAADPKSALLSAQKRAVLRSWPCNGAHNKLGIVAAPFFSRSGCESIIALCEAHALAANGWSKELAVRYPQTTTDLEVDRVPALRRWMIAAGVIPAVRAHYRKSHNACLFALDDLFVIKYDATGVGAQNELIPHRDAGDISFMVALSQRSDYTGGGTHFAALGQCSGGKGEGVVHLEQGELLSFDAALTHSGVPISAGVRYLLVGFCHCRDQAAAAEPGNINCDNLQMIADSSDSGGEDGNGKHAVVPEPVAAVWQSSLSDRALGILRSDALLLSALASDSVGEANHAASHWISAKEVPRTALEAFALEVFAMHTPALAGVNGTGVEFWIQHLHRGVGGAAELAMHESVQQAFDSSSPKPGERGVVEHWQPDRLPFHFDKDEVRN